MHIAIQEQEKMAIDPDKKAQIKAQSGAQSKAQNKAQSGAQVGALIFDKAPTKVLAKYSNYSNVFLVENVTKHPEHTGMNYHAIELEEGKQLSFSPIHSLGSVELKTLKTYIKTNLANGFIRPFKSLTETPILLDRKPDKSLRFCVDYGGLSNITIKN